MKTYYLTLSQAFPTTHAKAGLPTYFEEQLLQHIKLHTIRANYEFWKKRFEQIADGKACLSIRQWVGKPYGKGSTQREIARLTREDGIGLQKVMISRNPYADMLQACIFRTRPEISSVVSASRLAENDGLTREDWEAWFKGYDLSKPMAIIHFTSFRY